MTDDDYDALSQKQLASIKRDMRISLEDAAVRATYKVMTELETEQPKVRTGDCLLVGVCASEGHKIQVKQEPWRESASDYERGVIDGRQMQAQSSVDKAVNRMAQPEQEPVEHAVIAGALFDFMGWLTSRKERIVLSSADEASPAVNAITDFAKMRGLSLNDAKVQDWNTTPPQRKPLTDEEIKQDFEKWAKDNYVQGFELYGDSYHNGHTRNRWQGWLAAHRAIEAAHGIKE